MLMGLGIVILLVAIVGLVRGFLEEVTWLKLSSAAASFIGIALIVIYFNTAAGERTLKTWKSDTGGGLTRTVEVYDQSGNHIKTYEGKLDVETNEYGNKVLFDLNGKRTIIYNATVIVQEK